MPSWVKWLLGNGLVQTQVLKFASNFAAKAGIAVVAWLTALMVSKGYTINYELSHHIALVGGAVTALIGALCQLGYDALVDPRKVANKMTTAAVTGSIAAANDPQQRADVVQAVKTEQAIATAATGAPTTKDAAIARLRAGTA